MNARWKRQDRFKFNAVVSSYYDIDTPANYEEHEPRFYLSDVDVFCNQEIGIDYDVLFDTVKQQVKNLSEKEIGQIMQHFEDNSNSPECDFVTIKPDKILQCTGLKDKNGTLIYEGDIVKIEYYDFEIKHRIGIVEWEDDGFCITYHNPKDTKVSGCSLVDIVNGEKQEVIGNIYENSELLEVENER